MGNFDLAKTTLPKLETPRLIIGDMRNASDSELAAFLNADDHAYLREAPIKLDEYPAITEEFAHEMAQGVPVGSNQFIYKKHNGENPEIAGKFSLFGLDGTTVRIAPFILPSARGAGIIAEAYSCIMKGLRDHCGIEKVYLEVLPENRAMHRVMEKLGATPLGSATPIARHAFMHDDLQIVRYEFDLTKWQPPAFADRSSTRSMAERGSPPSRG